MDIILIVIAAIIGATITYYLVKPQANETNNDTANTAQKAFVDNTAIQIAQLAEQKKKADKMLSEAQDRISTLTEQLKTAIAKGEVNPNNSNLADIDKLNKKIKKLENELDDAEDELADAEKKLKNKASEFSALNQKHDELLIDLKIKTREIEEIREELKNKQEELNIKIKSLGFVQEILSAKVSQTEDIVQLNKNIDLFESFVKGQFTDLVSFLLKANHIQWNKKSGQEGLNDMKSLWYPAFDQWAATKRKSWLDGKTTVAFVGEFSAGKTSIVNRLLSQDDPNAPLLPVDTEATTAIPTYIASGLKPSYTFISDNKRKTITESTFKSVSKKVLAQIHGVTSLIKYFVMTYKNNHLEGLSILDTPGFNSNDPEDAERTIEVINECDALFWVFDVNVGEINNTSIRLIKNKLKKPLYVVINKVDTVADTDVDKVEQLIKNTLQREGITIEGIIRFSEEAPVDDIMRPIKSVSRNMARDTFVHDLKTNIENLIKILKTQYDEQHNKVNTLDQKSDNLHGQIMSCFSTMRKECDEAHGIPRWVEHNGLVQFFVDDSYEMTASEGLRLKQLLETIADTRLNTLDSLLEDRIQAAHDYQKALTGLYDAKDALQKANECFNEFKKVSKNL